MHTHEEWRPIPGYDGYEASSLGRVRVAKPMRIRLGSRGYLNAQIFDSHGVRRCKVVHRLVLKAFIGLPPMPDAVGNHRNGIKTDNRPENLEWATPGDNQRHAYRVLGRTPSKKSRFRPADIPRIREAYANGDVTIHGLAKLFGIHKQRIAGILGESRRKSGPQPGTISPKRAFTMEQETEICRRLAAGERNKDLAAEFGVTTMTIYRVSRRSGQPT